MTNHRPPRWGSWLLGRVMGAEDAEFVLGDLEEEFKERCAEDGPTRARRWYRTQVFGSARAHLSAPLRGGLWGHDLRYAARRLRRAPGFTALAVGTLGLGIGGAVTIGTLAWSVLRPLPYPEPEALVAVWETRGGVQRGVAPANYLDWRRMNAGFDGLAAHLVGTVAVTHGEAATLERVATVSGNFFEVVGAPALRGRTFDPTLNPAFAEREMVLAEPAAGRLFGTPSAAVGQSLRVDDLTYSIVGVAPARFAFPDEGLFGWVRSPTEAPEIRNLPPDFSLTELRDAWYFEVVGRVGPGETVASGRADLEGVAARLAETYPDTNRESGVLVVPLLEQTVADFDRILLALALAVALVLCAAWFNVVHLTRAVAEGRRLDAAVRISLGASRGSLARAYGLEGWLIGLAAGSVGLLLAYLAIDLSTSALLESVPRSDEIAVGPEAWGAALLLGVVAGAIVGRVGLAVVTPKASLRARMVRGGRGRGLIAAQVAVSIAVLTGTVLLGRSFTELGRVDLGFATESLVTMRVSLPDAPSLAYEERLLRYAEVERAVSILPGVESSTVGAELPLDMGMGAGVRIDGIQTSEDPPNSGWQPVAADYFETMGMTLRSGRAFSEADGRGSTDVAIVNEAFARDVLEGRDPLGATVTMGLDGHDRPLTIVGIVADTRTRGPSEPAGPVLYRPIDQTVRYGAGSMVLAARVTGGIDMAAVRAAVRGAAPEMPVSQAATGSELIRPFRANQSMLLTIMAVFATVALSIGLVGVYGVGTHSVRRARREIGVRLALGATGGRMTREIIRTGMRSAVLGVPFGLALAWGVGRGVRDLLFTVSPTDPASMALVVLVVLSLTASAFWAPARRAAKIDPAASIRDG